MAVRDRWHLGAELSSTSIQVPIEVEKAEHGGSDARPHWKRQHTLPVAHTAGAPSEPGSLHDVTQVAQLLHYILGNRALLLQRSVINAIQTTVDLSSKCRSILYNLWPKVTFILFLSNVMAQI
jgi:hypothetical protein